MALMGKSSTIKQGGYTLKANKKKKHADLELYGVVGWGINVHSFNYELKSFGELETITVKLNTIGGTFYDGLPIYNILKQHKAHVTVKVMGYALSMGSIIMLAGDRVEMAQNSLVMIHRAQGWEYGDAKQLRKGAERLEMHEEAILPDYMQRLGKTEAEVNELLQDETWYTAKRALAAGLIDEITDPIDIEEATQQIDENSWKECMGESCTMPDNYRHIVENVLTPPSFLEKLFGKSDKPDTLTTTENQTEDLEMDKAELQALLQENNKAIEASFDEKITALKSELTANTETETNENTETDEAKAHAEEVEALQAKLDASQKEVKELKEPAAGSVTKIDENTGANGDKKYSC